MTPTADRHARQPARALAGADRRAAARGARRRRRSWSTIKTAGDRLQDAPLSEAGGKRLFVKEIEDALLGGDIDLAVHSAKDMSAVLPEGLTIAGGAAARRSARRARAAAGTPATISTRRSRALGDAPAIGTGSVRRIAQLRDAPAAARASCRSAATSTRACASSTPASTTRWCSRRPACGGSASATRISAPIPLDACVPAPGQGIVAIETRRRRSRHATRCWPRSTIRRRRRRSKPSARSSPRSAAAASCRSAPSRVHDGDDLDMHAVVASLDGRRQVATSRAGSGAPALGELGRRAGRRARRGGRASRLLATRYDDRHDAGDDADQSSMLPVYIVGAGPGDPGAHQRARPALPREPPTWSSTTTASTRGCCAGAARTPRGSTSAPAAPRPLDQDAISLLLAEKAREGKTVVRLKWGDPFVFDSGGKEALFLHEQGIPFEVVPGIPAGDRRARLRGHPGHLSGRRRRRSRSCAATRRRATRRRRSTGRGWPASTARSSATPARDRSARSRARCSRTAAPGDESAALIYDGTTPSQQTDRRHARRRSPSGARDARAGDAGRRRAWPACASTCAGSTTGRCSAAGSSSRARASRRASSSTCSRSAAPKRSRRRPSGSRRRRIPRRSTAPAPMAGDVRLDRVHQRQRRRRVHAPAARARRRPRSARASASARSGRRRRERISRYGIRVDLMPDEIRAEAVIEALKAAGDLTGQRVLLPRADIAREVLADELRDGAAPRSPRSIAYRTCSPAPSATATTTSTACCSTARSTPSRSPAPSRSGTSRRSSARNRRPTCCSTTVVASIGPVTAEAAQQLGIETHGHAEALHDSGSRRRARRALRDRRSAELMTHRRARSVETASVRRWICAAGLAACAAPRRCARWCAKRGCRPDNFIYPLFVRQRRRPAARSRVDARRLPAVGRRGRQGGGGREGRGRARRAALRPARHEGRRRDRRADDPEAPVQTAVRALKREVPDLLVVTDVCLCEYTSHGHCGIVVDDEIVNDATVEQLVARRAVARRGRRRHRRAVRHDGRPRRPHPRRARRRRLQPDRDHGLRGEVLLGVLRSVPRGRRLGAGVRRSPLAPDGSGQRRGSAARGRSSISRKAPTSSWSSRRCPTSTSSRG